jgi:pilus assembly protein Flp/PilA
MPTLIRFMRNDLGATSIEYVIIASSIFLVIVLAVTAIGTRLTTIFANVSAGFPTN